MRFGRSPAALLAVLLLACSSSTDEPPAPNSAAAPAELPEPRTEVAAATWNGRIAVAGGLLAEGGVSNRVDLYLPETNRWEAGPPLPVPLHHSAMAVVRDRLYVVAGYTNRGSDWAAQTGVWSLGDGETIWREERPLSRPRGAHGAAFVNGRLIVAGGVVEGRLSASTESWAPGEAAWRPGPDLAEAREHLAMAAGRNGRAYVMGGRLGGLDSNLRTVESWDGVAPRWQAEPPMIDTRGGTSATATSNNAVCVAGGEEPQGTIAGVECLDERGWRRIASLRVPRHGLGVAALGTQVHVIGGGPEPGLFVSGAHEVLEAA